MTNIKYTIKEASRILGIHKDTLRRYEKIGLIDSERGPNDYRLYSPESIHCAYKKAKLWLKERPGMIDKEPQLNHKPLICLDCMIELDQNELVEWDPGYEKNQVCPHCKNRNPQIIHNKYVDNKITIN